MSKKSSVTANVRELAKQNGLQPVQQLLITTLAKQRKPVTLKDWALKANTSYGPMTKYVGSLDDETREANDEYYGYDSLLSAGLCETVRYQVDGREKTCFKITTKGKKIASLKLKK